jgi:HSP20 family protein
MKSDSKSGSSTALATQPSSVPAASSNGGNTYFPPVDLYETNDEFVLYCDLPGVRAEDLDLRFERGVLSLHGKVVPRNVPADGATFEYGVGDFQRTISLPVEVDTTKLVAEVKLGVLTVHLPKHEREKSQKITVKPA